MNKKVKSVIKEYQKATSPLGSYGGNPTLVDSPQQDADDL